MISVMLIDDEIQAIEYLESLIDWEMHGYKIVAKATDGTSALEKFDEFNPEIVISDISMPGTNGLDISSRLLARNPNVIIILLTAYSDFAYAQKALNLGVMSYVLKHDLDEKRLVDELTKARQHIEKNNSVRRIITRDLIRNRLEDSSASEQYQIREFNFSEEIPGRILLFMIIQDKPIVALENHRASISEPIDFAKVVFELRNQLPEGYQFVDFLTTRSQIHNLLFRTSDDLQPTVIDQQFKPFAGAILASISSPENGQTYSGLINWSSTGLSSISGLYKKVSKAFELRIPMRRSELLLIEELSMAEPHHWPVEIEKKFFEKLEQTLDDFNDFQASQELQSFFVTIQQMLPSRKVFMDICLNLNQVLGKWHAKHKMDSGNFHQMMLDKMNNCCSFFEVRDAYLDLIHWLITQVPDQRYNEYSNKIKVVVKYIFEHYAADLTIEDLAGMVNLSSSRLSRLFKSETGQGVLEYLTTVRVHKAMELLRQEHAKVYEVSETVGYKTSQYFSQVFKRVTGLTPNEYRDR